MKTLYRRITLVISFLLFFLLVFGKISYSQDSSSQSDQLKKIQDEIKQVEDQLSKTRQQKQTLANEISYFDNQIKLAQLRIAGTANKLEQIGQDITTLISKIGRLENSLDEIAGILLNRVRETYIKGNITSLNLLLTSNGFSELLSRLKYIKVAQAHDKKLMEQIQNTKLNYEDQKKLLEEKKQEQESLKRQLEGYKVSLNTQKQDKERLLEATQNDETKFQDMLANLNRQKQGLVSAVAASGEMPGIKVWPGDDNYFNQADSRWSNNIIGGYYDPSDPSYMWKYGCAVTSAAIVLSKLGIDIDPGRLSGNSIYYADLIAWQKISEVFPISIVGSPYSAPNWDTIDQNLSNGRWVIVHVWAFTSNGHFIVLKEKNGDDYKMHDPYFGPNLSFNDRYGKGVTDQMVIFQRN